MNLPYIQSELFRELVGLETLLKPEYTGVISKNADNTMLFYVWKYRTRGKLKRIMYQDRIHPIHIKTQSDITAEINRIWNAIPAECKKPNTWV